MSGGNGEVLLDIRNLRTHFFTDDGVVRAVDDVSLRIPRGKVLGVVGESGCGKSVTALSVLRLVSAPGRIVSGEILFDGVDLAKLPEPQMRAIRGHQISMIFQEPMTSLNPVFTVGNQIMEAVRLHLKKDKAEARKHTIEMLERVKIPSAATRVDEYPHQMSGGMRQRIMIAMALACNPKLLIADEPTTALDVTIQAQILELLSALRRELGLALLLITHDLGIVAEVADRVVVLYAGEVVEQAPTEALFASPRHPYTGGLLSSLPSAAAEGRTRLAAIPGAVPDPRAWPSGCRFADRCARAEDDCRAQAPALVGDAHRLRCYHPLAP
jgi:oligopeptide/dipeptide ABC transporter ATP-binding protein